jgi:hypothetical protein
MNKFFSKYFLFNVKRSFFIIALILLFLNIQDSYSKTNKKAFSKFSLNLNYVKNISQNEFNDFWKPRSGLEISISTPFYRGIIQGGIHYMPFYGQNPAYPDYKVYFYFLQWNIPLKLTNKIMWLNGFRFGSYAMEFDVNEITQFELVESELAAGLTSQISFNFINQWTVNLAGSYVTVFTNKRIKLIFISIGLSRSFTTPNWIRKILE